MSKSRDRSSPDVSCHNRICRVHLSQANILALIFSLLVCLALFLCLGRHKNEDVLFLTR